MYSADFERQPVCVVHRGVSLCLGFTLCVPVCVAWCKAALWCTVRLRGQGIPSHQADSQEGEIFSRVPHSCILFPCIVFCSSAGILSPFMTYLILLSTILPDSITCIVCHLENWLCINSHFLCPCGPGQHHCGLRSPSPRRFPWASMRNCPPRRHVSFLWCVFGSVSSQEWFIFWFVTDFSFCWHVVCAQLRAAGRAFLSSVF